MDQPSSSNITGRRKRPAVRGNDDDDDSFSMPRPLRKVRGNKDTESQEVVSNPELLKVKNHVDDIVHNKKVGTSNCFEYKSPLEMYAIEKMIADNVPIHEMAAVLESVQIIFGCRVDRLYQDVRQIDTALSSGDMSREKNNLHDNDVRINIESRKVRKKMAVADGMCGMSDFLDRMEDEDDLEEAAEDMAGLRVNEEETIAGEPNIDPTENSKDVDSFLGINIIPEDLIMNLAITRASEFRAELTDDVSAFVSADDAANDLKDASIDWLKSNPAFQKATKGSIDNTANAFHSLNHYGIHSPSGRALVLHPSIIDKHADDRFFTCDVSVPLANNTRILLENSLAKKPKILDNYLMLEVRDRPVIGRYKIMSKDVKKSTLPLSEASRERDLANLTFAEMNHRTSNLDMTIAGTSDISMLPGSHALPLAAGANDQTMISGRSSPNLNQTTSAPSQHKLTSDEYVPPGIDALALEESLIGKLPHDPMEMDDLSKIFDSKLKEYRDENTFDSKVWNNGLLAQEWGGDDSEIKASTRDTIQAGIEGWIKATDSWTNYDVVKMIVNRDDRSQLDENARDEQESYRNMVPEIGKSLFLVKSDDYMNNYPGDRIQSIKIVDEDKDISKMCSVDDEDDELSMEQIQKELQKRRNDQAPPEEPMDFMDFEAGAVPDIEFDDMLAAPADVDELMVAPVENESNDNVANILFNEDLDIADAEVRGERDVQREIEDIALASDEVAELMTAAPPKQIVGPSTEMREEIRNIGKTDNAHWIPPEAADQEKQAALIAQRKRREKRTKTRKLAVEDFVHYFRDISEEEIEREVTAAKCTKIADEKSTFLTEHQVYLQTLGIENKPHVAFDLSTLGKSGLFFQKSYGKIKLERVKNQPEQDLYMEDARGNKDSDCLNWLLSFSGFKCMENLEPITATESIEDQLRTAQSQGNDNDYVNFGDDIYYEEPVAFISPELQNKFLSTFSNVDQMRPLFAHYRDHGEYEDSDDEFDDSFDRQAIKTKNLDAAKHKKCLAEILKNDTLSMPSIQFALETLTLNQTVRQNNTTIRRPTTSERNATMTSPTPPVDGDTTLTAVFEYHSPSKLNHDVTQIMKALTEMAEYGGSAPDRSNDQPTTSEYGTVNTENRKVKIKGFHTLLSLALSMPPKMGESVKPSSIVSFLLHLCNESGLQIVQDRSKRTWMSDFIVLNNSESLPRGLVMGSMEEQDEFWKKTQDPDAVQGIPADQNSVFASLMSRPKAVHVRRGRAAAQRALTAPEEMSTIEEE